MSGDIPRIGIATWAFRELDLSSTLRMVAEMGYTSATVLGGFLDMFDADDLAEAEHILEERDMLLTVHSGFGTPEAIDEAKCLMEAEPILDWHARTGRIACLSYDVPWKELSRGIYRTDPTAIMDAFEKVLALTQGLGIRVAMEDCPLNAEHLERLADWKARFPHWGILVDLGHMNMLLREPKHDVQPLKPGAGEEYLRTIPVEIVELHIHGNDGSDDHHQPPYMGNVDFHSAVKTLTELGFSGIHTIEIGRAWCNDDGAQILPAAERSLGFWTDMLASTGG